jgi:hypothetical protein
MGLSVILATWYQIDDECRRINLILKVNKPQHLKDTAAF